MQSEEVELAGLHTKIENLKNELSSAEIRRNVLHRRILATKSLEHLGHPDQKLLQRGWQMLDEADTRTSANQVEEYNSYLLLSFEHVDHEVYLHLILKSGVAQFLYSPGKYVWLRDPSIQYVMDPHPGHAILKYVCGAISSHRIDEVETSVKLAKSLIDKDISKELSKLVGVHQKKIELHSFHLVKALWDKVLKP